jgi:hypothetical protein
MFLKHVLHYYKKLLNNYFIFNWLFTPVQISLLNPDLRGSALAWLSWVRVRIRILIENVDPDPDTGV